MAAYGFGYAWGMRKQTKPAHLRKCWLTASVGWPYCTGTKAPRCVAVAPVMCKILISFSPLKGNKIPWQSSMSLLLTCMLLADQSSASFYHDFVLFLRLSISIPNLFFTYY